MELTLQTSSNVSGLTCSACDAYFPLDQQIGYSLCCKKPLLVKYSFGDFLRREDLIGRVNSMWRYSEMLPLLDEANRITLGEGMTPIMPMGKTMREYGFENLHVKDEGLNPTGSFKSRGMSMAVSKAKELGITSCVIPTAGNAGGALSAYCAVAGMQADIIMPKHTPRAFLDECRLYGNEPILVDGLIDKCGELAAEIQKETGAFNMSTLKEPYRLEGKKTMGYEIAEQLNWELPDVIIYPTGGGTGLIGIWKAFQEMIELGWVDPMHLPRMVVVQSESCAPVVDMVHENHHHRPYGKSLANGLAVPVAFGKDLIKEVVLNSGGTAVAVSEKEIIKNARELSRSEGISFSPEGAATWAGLRMLVDRGLVFKHEKVLLINTGNASKYMEHFIQ